jgi:hypothetical protein
MRRALWAPALLILIGLTAWTGTAASSKGPLIEPAYYDGDEVGLLVPSGSSNNPNQIVSACFYLGPRHRSNEATSTLYALFVPGATQFSCQDGSRLHDHVIATAPGDPGYSGAWTVVRVTPGPNFDESDMPYKTETQVLAGVAAGELVLAETGFTFRAPVVPASP